MAANIENQWWERRGTMVYGEDHGPGTAPFIAEFATVAEAQRVVEEHNASLEGE